MLWEVVKGILLGTFTGITPGVHVNTIAAALENDALNPLTLFSMGLTHTYLDAFPSTFLGVPDEGTALGVLPAHRLVLKGRGMEVIRIALYSSFLATAFFIPLIPVYLLISPHYNYRIGRFAIVLLLIFLVLTEKGAKRVAALFIILLSGTVGWIVLNMQINQPMYHLLTGLFGVPVLGMAIFSGSGRVSPGRARLKISRGEFVLFSFIGTLLGMGASLIPAFTSSQAALIGSFFSKEERSFLTVVYSVNTSNFLFSLLNFLENGRARNGVVMKMPALGLSSLLPFVLVSLFVGLSVLIYGEKLSFLLASFISMIPYRLMNAIVLLALVVLSFRFDGSVGVLALLASSIVGFLAVIAGVKRTNCMGALMVPILLG